MKRKKSKEENTCRRKDMGGKQEYNLQIHGEDLRNAVLTRNCATKAGTCQASPKVSNQCPTITRPSRCDG